MKKGRQGKSSWFSNVVERASQLGWAVICHITGPGTRIRVFVAGYCSESSIPIGRIVSSRRPCVGLGLAMSFCRASFGRRARVA